MPCGVMCREKTRRIAWSFAALSKGCGYDGRKPVLVLPRWLAAIAGEYDVPGAACVECWSERDRYGRPGVEFRFAG